MPYPTYCPKTRHAGCAQVKALELQDQPPEESAGFVKAALQDCKSLHTLLLSGLGNLDLSLLAQAPRLECLALNVCFSVDLAALARLPKLR